MLKLGIIIAANAYHHMLLAGDACEGRCEPHYLVYSSLFELESLYQANRDIMDGFLFGGQLPFDYIAHNMGHVDKPSGYCTITAGDFYRTLLQLKADHPDLPLSKVYVDATEDYMELNALFDEQDRPKMRSVQYDDMIVDSFYTPQLYDAHIELYQTIWDQGDIEWLLTRLPGAEPALKRKGIRCSVVRPSRAIIVDTVDHIISSMEHHEAENAQIACCLVDCRENLRDVIDPIKVESILKSFNVTSNMAYIIRRDGPLIELTASNKDFRRLTQDYSIFHLHPFIRQRLGIPLLCGAGVGDSLYEAREHAMIALREARHQPDGAPAILSADRRIHTPDISGSDLLISGDMHGEIKALAAAVEMSPGNVQRILDMLDQTGRNRITSEELAGYLGITRRSAARILSHLESRGAARRVFAQHQALKGRPAKVYEINLGTAINDHK